MTQRTLSALVAATLGLGVVATAGAQQQPATNPDLQKQVEQLQQQVKELQSQKSAPAYTAKDVDNAVSSIIKDADRRTQLLGAGGGAITGHDGTGFHIRSADGAYDLQPYFQMQFRSVSNFGDFGDDDEGGLDIDDGFEIRRMKFGFQGHVINPKLKFNFRWATERNGGSPVLELAFAQYEFADTFAVKAGQWKDNVWREETTSSGRQLAVDRSFLNESLGGGETDYVQGVAMIWDNKNNMRAELAYHDGANSDNTNYQDTDFNFGASGRFEFKIMGDWKAYDDFSAMGNKKDLLVIGGGANWSQMGDGNVLWHTADVQWENTGGLGVFGSYVGRYSEEGDDNDQYDWGFLVQAGYMLGKEWEIFARYDMTTFEDDQANGEDTVHEITAGVNYYVKGHNAKFTVDAVYLPSGSPESHSGIGIRSQDTDDDQFLIRAQFQLQL